MPPKAMVRFWQVLLPRPMSGFMALQLWGSVTTKGQADIPDLRCHLEPCWCLAMLISGGLCGAHLTPCLGIVGEQPKGVRVGEMTPPLDRCTWESGTQHLAQEAE